MGVCGGRGASSNAVGAKFSTGRISAKCVREHAQYAKKCPSCLGGCRKRRQREAAARKRRCGGGSTLALPPLVARLQWSESESFAIVTIAAIAQEPAQEPWVVRRRRHRRPGPAPSCGHPRVPSPRYWRQEKGVCEGAVRGRKREWKVAFVATGTHLLKAALLRGISCTSPDTNGVSLRCSTAPGGRSAQVAKYNLNAVRRARVS
jgi:hypothetical protein